MKNWSHEIHINFYTEISIQIEWKTNKTYVFLQRRRIWGWWNKKKVGKPEKFFKAISLLHIFEQNPNKIQGIPWTAYLPKSEYLCVCALETSHYQLPNVMSLTRTNPAPTVAPATLIPWHYFHSTPLPPSTASSRGSRSSHWFLVKKVFAGQATFADWLVTGLTALITAELIVQPLPTWGHCLVSLSFSLSIHLILTKPVEIQWVRFLPFCLISSNLPQFQRHGWESLEDAHKAQLQNIVSGWHPSS